MVARRDFLTSTLVAPLIYSMLPAWMAQACKRAVSPKAAIAKTPLTAKEALFIKRLDALHKATGFQEGVRDLLSPKQASLVWNRIGKLAESTDIPLERAIASTTSYAQKTIAQTTAGTNSPNLGKFFQKLFTQDQNSIPDELYYERLEQIIETTQELRNIINENEWTMQLEQQLSNLITRLAQDAEITIPEESNQHIKEFLLLKRHEFKDAKEAFARPPIKDDSHKRNLNERLALTTNLTEEAG